MNIVRAAVRMGLKKTASTKHQKQKAAEEPADHGDLPVRLFFLWSGWLNQPTAGYPGHPGMPRS